MLSLTVLKGSVYIQLSFDSCYAIHVCHTTSLQVSSVHVKFKKNAEINAAFCCKKAYISCPTLPTPNISWRHNLTRNIKDDHHAAYNRRNLKCTENVSINIYMFIIVRMLSFRSWDNI